MDLGKNHGISKKGNVEKEFVDWKKVLTFFSSKTEKKMGQSSGEDSTRRGKKMGWPTIR